MSVWDLIAAPRVPPFYAAKLRPVRMWGNVIIWVPEEERTARRYAPAHSGCYKRKECE